MGDACDASLRKNVFLIEVETFRERLRDTLGDACDASLRKNVLLTEVETFRERLRDSWETHAMRLYGK
ncbi:MAG: hypothetical protein M1391_02745 [Bacteroidetes bacterium]|nr:hypothetical protein [Bacteroidota bacterium]